MGKTRREKRPAPVTKSTFRYGYVWLIIIVGFLLLVIWPQGKKTAIPPLLTSRPLPVDVPTTNPDELVSNLMNSLHPDRPENVYMPGLVREKFAWAISQKEKGFLEFFHDQKEAQSGNVMMHAGFNDQTGLAEVHLVIPRLADTFRRYRNNPQLMRNVVALTFVHELVHLEKGRDYLKSTEKTKKAWVMEEARAWHKVILGVIRPLRKIGQPVGPGYEKMDDELKKCGDSATCPWLIVKMEAMARVTHPTWFDVHLTQSP